MLIELTDSLMDFTADEKESVRQSLSNIMRGYWEGNHLLMASPGFCVFFSLILTDHISRSALHHIDENASFIPSVSNHLRVVLCNPDPNRMEVGYDFFLNTLSIQPTFFLCESFNDVRFYKFLVKNYYYGSHISSFDLCGGGGAIAEFYKKIRRKDCISLTIVDSDRFFPGSALGPTAEGCKKVNTKPCATAHLHILDCREVENLIPINSLQFLSIGRAGRLFIQKLHHCKRLDFLKFYDLKCGITKGQIMSVKGLFTYVEEVFKDLYKRDFSKKLQTLKEEDIVFQLRRKDILQHFNDRIKYIDKDIFENERKKVAEIVFTYLCSRGPEPFS